MTADLSKLAFYSGTRYERIALKNHVAFSVAAFGIQTLTISHNLGYVPYYKLFYTYGDGKYFELFAGNGSYGIDGNGGQVDTVYADSTSLYIELSENNGSLISGAVYYRIYAEPQT